MEECPGLSLENVFAWLGSHGRCEGDAATCSVFHLPRGGEMSRPVRRLSEVSVSPKVKGVGRNRAASTLAPCPAFFIWCHFPLVSPFACRDEPGGVLCANTWFQFLSPAVTRGHICKLTFSEPLALAHTVRVCSLKSLATGSAAYALEGMGGAHPCAWPRYLVEIGVEPC